MIRGGFLGEEDRARLIGLARDGSAASRVTRRANAIVLLDARTNETSTMLTDHGLGLNDHQGIHNARRNPIEAGKNQTVEIAESQPLWRFSSQHIELVAQRQDLRLERNP